MKYRHVGFIVLSISYLFLMSQIGLAYWSDYIERGGFYGYLGNLIAFLLLLITPIYYGVFLAIDRKNKPKIKSPIA